MTGEKSIIKLCAQSLIRKNFQSFNSCSGKLENQYKEKIVSLSMAGCLLFTMPRREHEQKKTNKEFS